MKKREGLKSAGEVLAGLAETARLVPAQAKPARVLPIPDKSEFENHQLNLFQTFLANTAEENETLSNAIDLWDSVPRYSVSRQQMTKIRVNDTYLNSHTTVFQHRGRTYTRVIHPASITDHDKHTRFYYPSANEELVEHALRKLAIDKQAGYFDKPNYRSGVMFSLYELREEMKKRGHARSYQQLVESLNILSGAVIEVIPHAGDGVIKSAVIPVLVAVSKAKLSSDPKSKWMVQFHPLVTGSIDKVTYRQFNYSLMMSHRTQLARWLHQQLVLKYTFASYQTPFEMLYSTIKRDSGLLDGYKLQRQAVSALEEAFDELTKGGVIMGTERRDVRGQRSKLHDVVFQIRPSPDFVKEAKAANRRHTDGIESVTRLSPKPENR